MRTLLYAALIAATAASAPAARANLLDLAIVDRDSGVTEDPALCDIDDVSGAEQAAGRIRKVGLWILRPVTSRRPRTDQWYTSLISRIGRR